MSEHSIRAILFDIGGVLVEPSGVATMLTWMGDRVSAQELWRMWLTSPSVRASETGRMAATEFAESVIVEFSLPVRAPEFLQEMPKWSTGLFPGALDFGGRHSAAIPASDALQYQRRSLAMLDE